MAGGLLRRGPGRRPARQALMAEINVTPMVDVMLVLLIIFMVAAPLLTVGVPVDLPKSEAPAINENKEPLVISINAAGDIYLQETKVEAGALVAKLQAVTNNNPDQEIFVRGDRTINYGRIMEVIGLVAQAGFPKVSLVAELPAGKNPTHP